MKMKEIKKYPGYFITDSGDIFSIKPINGKRHPYKIPVMRKLKLQISKWGKARYLRIELRNKNKVKKYFVHRLVAKSFLKNEKQKPEVNHKNGNKLDNRVENLEWCTRSENHVHAFKIGLRISKGNPKINYKTAMKIRKMYKPYKVSRYKIAKNFGISPGCVQAVIENRTWCING